MRHADLVADYYDSNTREFYLRYWDTVDIHFGLFDQGSEATSVRQATQRMTACITAPGKLMHTDFVVDAGCGVGGAAFDVANEHGCRVTGLTVSQVQVGLATSKAAEAELSDRVRFSRCDCSQRLPFDDDSVDVVMTIEAACHFADKPAFVRECARVLRPGGRLLGSDWMVTDKTSSSDYEALIEPVCDAWRLAGLESPSSWRAILGEAGFEVRDCEDLGDAVLENARILARAHLELTLEEANGCHRRERAALWKRQYETLVCAWLERRFTIGRFFATLQPGV